MRQQFGGLLLVLFASLQTAPAKALGPADGPGCLGVRAEECVRWLRATMVLDENFLAEAMAKRHQVDVNGRPLKGLVVVNARLPQQPPDEFVILLHLRPDDSVSRVEANLLVSLLEANTEPLYDRSKLYELVWRLLGRRCAGLAKLELYRFFENAVKPRLVQQREDHTGGLYGLHRIYSRAVGVPYCGVAFTYNDRIEWRGSTELKAALKITRFASIELQ